MELLENIPDLLAKKDERAFEQVFKSQFKHLHSYAFIFLKDEDEAEDIVQQVFFKFWERAESLQFISPITAYLYCAVRNGCLSYLKHEKIKLKYHIYASYQMKNEHDHTFEKIVCSELKRKLYKAVTELPGQCSVIFQLSRFAGLKYHEIATALGISPKTVENQMGKALKLLRLKLADFFPA